MQESYTLPFKSDERTHSIEEDQGKCYHNITNQRRKQPFKVRGLNLGKSTTVYKYQSLLYKK